RANELQRRGARVGSTQLIKSITANERSRRKMVPRQSPRAAGRGHPAVIKQMLRKCVEAYRTLRYVPSRSSRNELLESLAWFETINGRDSPMRSNTTRGTFLSGALLIAATVIDGNATAQLRDKSQLSVVVPGSVINKSWVQEIGAGRGDIMTPNSSAFIIARDPFRAIRRGRQIFQRKFQMKQ